MSAADATGLEALGQAVGRAVAERLAGADPGVVSLVVREVMSAVAREGLTPAARAPAPPAADNGDGTITTPLGAILPRPDMDAALALCGACVEQRRQGGRDRAVVTVTGINRRGVVAAIAGAIADAGGDIEDLSQTLVNDYFTMILLVDISTLARPFPELKARLQAVAEELGVHAVVMHEDVVRALQRI